MPILGSSTPVTTVSTTAQSIIIEALELLGALAAGESPSAEDLASAKRTFNFMLDSLNSEKLGVPALSQVSKVLTASDGSYSIGEGGDIDTKRPPRIAQGQAFLKDGTVEYELKVLLPEEWARIVDKTVTGLPAALYFESTVPTGTVNLYPAPSSGYTLILWLPVLFAQIENLNASFYLPPAYPSYLSKMLAVELAPKFGKDAPAKVIEGAGTAKGNLKRMNKRTPKLMTDVPGQGRRGSFNINTGWYQ